MKKIEEEQRFIETIEIIKDNINYKNFIEIGGADASFKNFVNHSSWKVIDKYGNPDIKIDLDGKNIKLPFDDNSIECIILTEVLEHLRMGRPLMKEINRCLVRNGNLIISVPNMVSLGDRLKWLFGIIPDMAASSDCGNELSGTGFLEDGFWEGGHVVDFNKERLQKYIESSGLDLVKFYKSSVEFKGILIPKILTTITLGNYLIAIFKKPNFI